MTTYVCSAIASLVWGQLAIMFSHGGGGGIYGSPHPMQELRLKSEIRAKLQELTSKQNGRSFETWRWYPRNGAGG